MIKAIDKINEAKRRSESKEEVIKILQTLEPGEYENRIPADTCRFLWSRGLVTKINPNKKKKDLGIRELILFSDILLICKHGHFAKTQVAYVWKLSDIRIDLISDTDRKDYFQLTSQDKKSLYFKVSQENEKRQWIDIFAKALPQPQQYQSEPTCISSVSTFGIFSLN
jgi:hypothetical protein